MEISQLIEAARKAQREFELSFDQESVDQVVKAMGKIIYDHAEELAREAIDETRMGVYEDKVAKNKGKVKGVWYDLKGKRSMDILSMDERTGLIEVAKPIGVVAAITPTTNPIVTPATNAMCAVKTKNAIIIAPHPRSKKCSTHAIKLIQEVLDKMNVPKGLVQIIEEPSIEKTQALMTAADVVVATGGMAMVKSAYSSGKPSFGVGQGNVQVVLDRHIDYVDAAKKVIAGRAFDNGIICSGEQSFIYPKENKAEVFKAFENAGVYFAKGDERDKIANTIFENGIIAKDVVGQSAEFIAKLAGINLPKGTKVIGVEAQGVGKEDILCKEKMCPVIIAIPYTTFEEAVDIAETNLKFEGNGHTAAIHSNDQSHIISMGSRLSVSRLIVNAPSATTAGGHIQNGLNVTNTLGCGTWGNNSISENFYYKHLLNITRIAPLSSKIEIPTDEEIWK